MQFHLQRTILKHENSFYLFLNLDSLQYSIDIICTISRIKTVICYLINKKKCGRQKVSCFNPSVPIFLFVHRTTEKFQIPLILLF